MAEDLEKHLSEMERFAADDVPELPNQGDNSSSEEE